MCANALFALLKGAAGPGGARTLCGMLAALHGIAACAPPSIGQGLDRAPTTTPRLVALELVRALPIERWDNFQPSGLLWQGGKLLTVSDKHDGHVFELLIERHQVRVREHQSISGLDDTDGLDLEGMCSDGAGGLLLVSEEQTRILRVGSDASARWYSPPLKALGARAGLFQLANATLEGVAHLSDGRLVIAAERSERGLLELAPGGDFEQAQVWSLPTTLFHLPAGRTPDFSDLTTHGDALFALIRNGHLVVRLRRDATGWQEHEAWSFEQSENDPRYAYVHRRYGMAEGLAVDEHFVYVVLDNNGDARVANPRDSRPQLLIFRRPLE